TSTGARRPRAMGAQRTRPRDTRAAHAAYAPRAARLDRVREVFSISARSPDSRARRGTLHLAHGDVQTPAFVPLATRGAVKTLEPRDVAALGYELILGNTFHLFLAPGP